MFLCAPGLVCFPFNSFSSLFCKTSTTNDDFPEPETPVTTVKIPSGKLTSSFFKLFAVAPETESKYSGFIGRHLSGIGIVLYPLRYWAVRVSFFIEISCGLPHAEMFPP